MLPLSRRFLPLLLSPLRGLLKALGCLLKALQALSRGGLHHFERLLIGGERNAEEVQVGPASPGNPLLLLRLLFLLLQQGTRTLHMALEQLHSTLKDALSILQVALLSS
jgi:hypothetical protein